MEPAETTDRLGAVRFSLTWVVIAPVVVLAVTGAFLAAAYQPSAMPWDLKALWSVKVGTSLRGYGWLFGDDVRFVLLGGTEQSVSTIRVAFGAHVVVVSMVLALALQALARRGQT